MKYGPYICIGVVLAVLFVLWAFWGGKDYEFVGLAPLSPDTCGSYTGSLYTWGDITPAAGYDPIQGHSCVPSDAACRQEPQKSGLPTDPEVTHPPIAVDNTPPVPAQFLAPKVSDICPREIVTGQLPSLLNLPRLPSLPKLLGLPGLPGASKLPGITIPRQQRTGQRGRFISRGERMCCQTMERIYGVPFFSVWPKWLVNPNTNHTLELDCYNEELQLAVEYNGEQHYKWPNFTNQTYQQFLDQAARDELKRELCDRNGVYLIVVPYHVPYDNIPAFIMSHLPETIQKRLQEEKTLVNMDIPTTPIMA